MPDPIDWIYKALKDNAPAKIKIIVVNLGKNIGSVVLLKANATIIIKIDKNNITQFYYLSRIEDVKINEPFQIRTGTDLIDNQALYLLS